MSDRDIVRVQIGRPPRGEISVAARCVYGLPVVIETAPRLSDGEPFPTRYWLTCPEMTRKVGTLESAGRMRELTALLDEDVALRASYARAHASYLSGRAGDVSAGGMPERVKCLHALLAHELVDANPIGAIVRSEITLDCPGPCVVEDGDHVVPAPGHPYLR